MAEGIPSSDPAGDSAAPATIERRKQAVVVVHGMGEQRPMETLRTLAETLADGRGVFIIPDQSTGSAELARIRIAGRNIDPASPLPKEPATDFYELYYADLLGGGTFAQLRGWVLGLLLRWPHQVPKEVWRIWVFLWVVIIGTMIWLGPLLTSNPVKHFTDFISAEKGNPNPTQVVIIAVGGLLLLLWLVLESGRHATARATAPNPTRSLSVVLSYMSPPVIAAAVAAAAWFGLPWGKLAFEPYACAPQDWYCNATSFARQIFQAQWVQVLIAAIVWFGVTKFGVPYFGDVARYVGVSPDLIAGRKAIRERGIALLTELHDRKAYKDGKKTDQSEYDRIIVIAHSLGSIVAYDVMRLFWAQRNISNFNPVPADAIEAMRDMADLPIYSKDYSDAHLNTLVGLQNRIAVTMRAEKDAWRISDFITMGSPLARADFLMSRDWPRFQKNIDERRFPTCPPVLEKAKNPEKDKDGFIYGSEKAGSKIPHHGAMFAATRWLVIYDPIRKFLFGGDFIGGPVKKLFGHGVSQLAVRITRRSWIFPNVVTHTDYWRSDVDTHFHEDQSQLPSNLKSEVQQGQIVINVLRKCIW